MNVLRGKRVVITRAIHQAEALAEPLRRAGAEVILLPAIHIAPPGNPEPLRRAATQIEIYDWIIFSSANAVEALTRALPAVRFPRSRPRVAAVGSATREAAEELGWPVDVVPAKFVAEELMRVLESVPLQDRRVLIPSAAVARDVVPEALRQAGARVEVVEAYRNVLPPGTIERAQQIFSADPLPDWVTFASPSAVENLVRMVGAGPLGRTCIASIGPVTSAAVRRHNLRVSVEPEEHTIEALAAAIVQTYCAPPPQ